MADRQGSRIETARSILSRQLDNAVADRDPLAEPVDTPAGPAPRWLVHERQVMHTAVNHIRDSCGLPPVDLAVIEQIDDSTAGHVDWADQFTSRCAKVAVGERWHA